MNRTIFNTCFSLIFALAAFQAPFANATTPPSTDPDDPLPYCNEELRPEWTEDFNAELDSVRYDYESRTDGNRCTPQIGGGGTESLTPVDDVIPGETIYRSSIRRHATDRLLSFISCYKSQSGLTCDASPTSDDILLTYYWSTSGNVRVSSREARSVTITCASDTGDSGGGSITLYVSSGYTLGTIEAKRTIKCSGSGTAFGPRLR
ncbi:hypothetical protein C7S18_04750 [Ahniella affigens]|uniref:Ig-like domain-containing protein n=1 Tax=Ahniella affigens TaxID=2021234 RepID=A0A2P1PNX9_9GAMM|nr:hypothetical protein [Ahniella affigens]AVP96550.1 hypothetical protein C7S18_04750 [Ahniella affigens]